jgi:phosphohistidine swiveling domain-containing protein
MWTRALATADASCGGKAHGLARLIAAGLRVPDGFVIDDRAFRVATGDAIEVGAVIEPDPGISVLLGRAEPAHVGHTLAQLASRIETATLPQELLDEVTTRARHLGGPFAVRSSATLEDGEAGAAAGVFSSRTAVALEDLWPAIRAVWVSALTPLAAAYARRRGGQISISVIVQRFVDGEQVTVYTRPPGRPEANELWWQHGSQLSQIARSESVGLIAAERAIGATGGADLELILPWVSTPGPEAPFGNGFEGLDWDQASYVQARPIVHPVVKPLTTPPPTVLAPLDDGRVWTLDVMHNPDPLSTAQADLVERVDRAGAAPWSARVCAGYLYTAPRIAIEVATAKDGAELERRTTEIEERMFAALHMQAGELAPATLEQALDRYVEFVRIWAHEYSPVIAASRKAFPLAVPRSSAVESILLDAAAEGRTEADVLPGVGVLAPAWDVAVPTFAERPGLIRDALARASAALGERIEHEDLGSDLSPDDLTHAVIAAELAEQDDDAFARAQWSVRRAILARADELGIPREDAFWIPLDELVRGSLDIDDVRRRASGARAASTRAASWRMPILVPDSSTRDPGVALVGIGSGHQVSGRVRRFESLASAIVVGRGDIVVTRAVTPALAVIVIGCAAIISETGRPLDHGAAMARELGIPCIVSCRDAWAQLADGMIVTIDHDVVSIVH